MINERVPTKLVEKLLAWFASHQRDLPWRKTDENGFRDPYRVWISEIMLQQTRVEVVVDFFNRWMEVFPNIHTLAEASEEKIMGAWAGLGYYSRARNIHKSAKSIVASQRGFPKSKDLISKLPGIGPYTTGAVCSLAFKQSEPILDGNLIRIFSRFYGRAFEFWQASAQKKLWHFADLWVKAGPPEKMNEALMELGAMVCKPQNPDCINCPLAEKCIGLKENKLFELPLKKKKREKINLDWIVLFNFKGSKVQLVKNAEKQLLQKQWVLPTIVKAEWDSFLVKNQVSEYIELVNGSVMHSITHHKINAIGVRLDRHLSSLKDPTFSEIIWVEREDLKEYLTSSLYIKMLRKLNE